MKYIDQLLTEIREQEPTAAEAEQASARVRQRLFPAPQSHAAATTAIRNCAGFVELFPAALAGSLDSARQMLLDVHIRECVECRRALNRMRQGAAQVAVMPAPQRRVNYQVWAIAASVVLVTGAVAYWGVYEFPALHGGPRATVEQVDGSLYRVNGSALVLIAAGTALNENDLVRTAKNSTAILRLNDGSKVEMNQRAEVYVTREWTGSTVHLSLGSIIVAAAKQRSGELHVATADCNVSVKGTVFSVDAGTKGSRVAVAEGTVWVDHGTQHDVLHKGDQTSTASTCHPPPPRTARVCAAMLPPARAHRHTHTHTHTHTSIHTHTPIHTHTDTHTHTDMTPAPIAQEFTWSSHSAQYLALLGDFADVHQKIAAHSRARASLRVETDLVPAGQRCSRRRHPEYRRRNGSGKRAIFRQKLSEKGALADWWNRIPAAKRDNFEKEMQQLTTASQYLGNEIVVYTTDFHSSPVIVAEETRPGLDTYLKGQLAPSLVAHMTFDNNLFVISDTPVTTSGGFTGTALYQKIAPEYQQGAGWLFAADLATVAADMPVKSGMQDVRYFLATSKVIGGGTLADGENHASVIFSKDRTGVASWLAVPGPMGSLNFVSPDAGFVVTTILKNPTLIVDDMVNSMSKVADQKLALTDLASAFGGELTVALDGPLLPVPSWKIVAEVYDPGRIQSAFQKLTTEFNTSSIDHSRTGNLTLTESMSDGQPYYTLKFDKLPWEADWTFVDGYWVAAASHQLVARAIQNRLTGYTLPKSAAFQQRLLHDGSTDFSALVYTTIWGRR